MLHHSIVQENCILYKLPRIAELIEKVTPGIIALCGNKCDLEERKVAIEVNLLI
jgi:hypothetical protein